MTEKYTVYFNHNKPSVVPYSPQGCLVPSSSAVDLATQGSAFIGGGPRDASTSSQAIIHSVGAGGSSRIVLRSSLFAPGHTIDSVSLSFRYIAAYDGKLASTANVLLVNASDQSKVLRTLLKTGPLGNYSWGHFNGYSPPIVAKATGLNLANDVPVLVVLEVHNNDRCLLIPVDDLAAGFDARVMWTPAPDELLV